MKPPVTVGQTLYGKRKWREGELFSMEVIRVGRKYFTARFNHVTYLEFDFSKETWDGRREEDKYYELYSSIEEREKQQAKEALEEELKDKCRQIGEAFNHGWNRLKIPIEDIREIHAIISKHSA